MAQGADIRAPADARRDADGGDAPHGGGDLLLAGELRAVLIQLVVLRHHDLQLFQLLEGVDEDFHDVLVLADGRGRPHSEVVEADEAQALLRDEDATDTADGEIQDAVFQHGTVTGGDDVLEVGGVVGADAGDVWIEAGFEAPVAEASHEFGEPLNVGGRVRGPVRRADVLEVGAKSLRYDPRLTDEENVRLHAVHMHPPRTTYLVKL